MNIETEKTLIKRETVVTEGYRKCIIRKIKGYTNMWRIILSSGDADFGQMVAVKIKSGGYRLTEHGKAHRTLKELGRYIIESIPDIAPDAPVGRFLDESVY